MDIGVDYYGFVVVGVIGDGYVDFVGIEKDVGWCFDLVVGG